MFSPEPPERPPPEFAGLQDVREVTVMRRAEFDRIQFQLRKRQVLEEERQKRIAAKEQLHALSQERVKEWGNTIQVCTGTGQFQFIVYIRTWIGKYNLRVCGDWRHAVLVFTYGNWGNN